MTCAVRSNGQPARSCCREGPGQNRSETESPPACTAEPDNGRSDHLSSGLTECESVLADADAAETFEPTDRAFDTHRMVRGWFRESLLIASAAGQAFAPVAHKALSELIQGNTIEAEEVVWDRYWETLPEARRAIRRNAKPPAGTARDSRMDAALGSEVRPAEHVWSWPYSRLALARRGRATQDSPPICGVPGWGDILLAGPVNAPACWGRDRRKQVSTGQLRAKWPHCR